MFSDKSILEVNREERFYCAILFHLLLASPEFRAKSFALLTQRTGLPLDCSDFEVFVEAAFLRDYWSDLSDSGKIEAVRRKTQIIQDVFHAAELDGDAVLEQPFIWRGKNPVFPGRWMEKAIQASTLSDEAKKKLHQVQQAFNNKPDIVIVSQQAVIVIEAKLESPVDPKQRVLQRLICKTLWPMIPRFNGCKIEDTELTLHAERTTPATCNPVFWKEFAMYANECPVDEFSKTCLSQMVSRYYPVKGTLGSSG